jgi:hypothetical protein
MKPDAIFEWGIAGLAAIVLAGLAVFLGSEIVGSIRRGQRHRESPPEPGAISPERHHHVQSTAAR